MSKPILSIHDLTIAFDDNVVVDKVSFDLYKGKTLGIVGESGSGKSITCLSIMGLLPETATVESGQIQFEFDKKSSDLLQQTESVLRKVRGKHISLIFQEPFSALNPTMRCGKQIMEAVEQHMLLSREAAKAHIIKMLERVGIVDAERIYQSYPHELSGGQLQRVLIAMAVSCHPSIIIADEPTTALDVTVQKSVLNLFKELQDEFGCAIIFISHDLGVIKEIADDVLVMQKGVAVEKGKINDIFQTAQHPYTRGLLACRPPLDKRLHRLPVVEDFLKDELTTKIDEIRKTDHLLKLDELSKKEPLLIGRSVRVSYAKKTNWLGNVVEWVEAVHPTNLIIRRGESLGLVGESGSGKSSLGKALLRLNPSAHGQVQFDGTQIYDLDSKSMRRMRKRMQIIFQDPYSTLNPKMRIGKAIQEVLYVHDIGNTKSERKEKTINLMEICGLEADHYSRLPHQFSGGQRQRISIARTLAVSPEFIVCDESVSALDVSVQAQILNLLKDLQDQFGLSYLFISHDLSVVKHMSDRIMVMKDGKIIEEGDPYSIFDAPKTEYTRSLIAAIPGVD